MEIFTENFKNLKSSYIVDEINKNGYFAFEEALTGEFLNLIEEEATENKTNLNNNVTTGVFLKKQYYFVNLLTKSQQFFRYLTSDVLYDIYKDYFGNNFRLKAMRYYETYSGHIMPWHSDNKTEQEILDTKGLIFIFYVSDVFDGEFQYISGSHNWSLAKGVNEFSDEYINQNYSEDIKSFKLPKGSIIIYNTYGIHRAKPIKNKNYVRKSIFTQIDNNLSNGETIIVNTSLINVEKNWVKEFLGFGLKQTYQAFPKTNMNTLPINVQLSILLKIIFNLPKNLILSSYLTKLVYRKISRFVSKS